MHQESEASERPTTGDALAYLKVVKEEFKDTPEKYDQFLAVIKAFQAHRSVPLFIKSIIIISILSFFFLSINSHIGTIVPAGLIHLMLYSEPNVYLRDMIFSFPV